MNRRIEKINELVRQHVSDIILKNISLKEGVFVTISKVDTSSDLRYTHVFISTFPEKEITYVEKTLGREIGNLQRILGTRLRMKPVPKIVFKTDLTESKADEIEKIMKRSDF